VLRNPESHMVGLIVNPLGPGDGLVSCAASGLAYPFPARHFRKNLISRLPRIIDRAPMGPLQRFRGLDYAKPRRKCARKLRRSSEGIAHCHASFNNTIVTITAVRHTLAWSTSGAQGFKGSPSTTVAAQVAPGVGKSAVECGVKILSSHQRDQARP